MCLEAETTQDMVRQARKGVRRLDVALVTCWTRDKGKGKPSPFPGLWFWKERNLVVNNRDYLRPSCADTNFNRVRELIKDGAIGAVH